MPTEDSVYLPSVCAFEIAGKRYVWPEPVRAASRRQRAVLLRLSQGAFKANADAQNASSDIERNMIMAAYSQDATADIMDFFAEFNKELREDRDAIWAKLDSGEVSDAELVAAYKAVLDFVMAPFVKKAKTMAAASSANGTPSTAQTSSTETTNA